jgi:syntaxin 5
MMAVSSIQDRTTEFRSVLSQVQKRHVSSKVGTQRQSLLADSQRGANEDAKPRRSEFARKAAEIGRGISATMAKLEKLAQRKETFNSTHNRGLTTYHYAQ